MKCRFLHELHDVTFQTTTFFMSHNIRIFIQTELALTILLSADSDVLRGWTSTPTVVSLNHDGVCGVLGQTLQYNLTPILSPHFNSLEIIVVCCCGRG